ncbi:MAG TPA: hypothetical protein ENI19_02110 [Candidatus Nealsonbacteria bacterium]|uniref:GIY-YIG domain-containing protein n=1 Tax=marine sediment metagenome TaxID=412755 RepID=A0A0F9XIP5_9ZZZZ|nr:hypothetical protein [Candidatus Nealsonbacteria bacterium]HEB46482.1 hypothetical protein [Candidatus Nealsonbacteria bacterium]
MKKFRFLDKNKISELPKGPGVYAFSASAPTKSELRRIRRSSLATSVGEKKDREFLNMKYSRSLTKSRFLFPNEAKNQGSTKDRFLYIGKASNIRKRVKNHFSRPGFKSPLFINKIRKIGYLKTGSEIEALILEAKLIKKYQPKYNILWRDDKNYFFVGITGEYFPQVFLTHQPAKIPPLSKRGGTGRTSPKSIYIGPFVEGSALKITLRILRKIFPYYTVKRHPETLCLWCQLNLCPGPNPDLKKYKKNIKNLITVLKGGKQLVLKKLQKEMKNASALKNFEIAARIRDQINAIERVFAHTHLVPLSLQRGRDLGGRAKIFREKKLISISLEKNWLKIQEVLQNLLKIKKKISRIEAYDISNIQGKLATGSMVTFINGQPDKNCYRKFKIRITDKPNDIAMIKEIIKRRLKHSEWGFPDLILIDGGKAQLNAVQSTISNQQLAIPVIALAKKKNELFVENRKPSTRAEPSTRAKLGAGPVLNRNKVSGSGHGAGPVRDLNKISPRPEGIRPSSAEDLGTKAGVGKPILLKSLPREIFNLILQLRDEAHRFALAYHRKLREIAFGNSQRRDRGKRIGVSSRGGKTGR